MTDRPDPDAAVTATIAGDLESYSLVVRAFQGELRAFLAVRCHDPAAIEELCHDTFVRAFERLERFDSGQGPFVAWLKGIARNQLFRYHRASARRARHVDRLELLQLVDAQAMTMDEDDDWLAALRRCLDKLPAARRDLLDLRYRENRDIDTVAGLLGRTKTWVTTNLQRTRDAVRECITGSMSP